MVQCLWISSPNGTSSKSTMETVIRRAEQSNVLVCRCEYIRVCLYTFSVKCLWLQICGRACKMVTLLLLVAFG